MNVIRTRVLTLIKDQTSILFKRLVEMNVIRTRVLTQ